MFSNDQVENGLVWLQYSPASADHLAHQILSPVADIDVCSRDQREQVLYELQFLWEKRYFYFVNIPIIVITHEASLM